MLPHLLTDGMFVSHLFQYLYADFIMTTRNVQPANNNRDFVFGMEDIKVSFDSACQTYKICQLANDLSRVELCSYLYSPSGSIWSSGLSALWRLSRHSCICRGCIDALNEALWATMFSAIMNENFLTIYWSGLVCQISTEVKVKVLSS
jgi:hypothetical protein